MEKIEMDKQIRGLIALYYQFSSHENTKKKQRANSLSTSKIARAEYNESCTKVNCYAEFINHLEGLKSKL
jgi:hypothetical protein